jgi:hypothetical protein
VIRSVLAAVLVLALIPATALANTSTWASRTVLDRAAFSETVGRALDTPAARGALAERLAAELFAAILRVDDRLRFVLGPLLGESPAASDAAIIARLEPWVAEVLDDARTQGARDQLVLAIHDALVGAVEDPGATVRIEGDALVLDGADLLRAVIGALRGRLGDIGVSIPETTTIEITLAASPAIASTPDGLSALERFGVVAPLLAIAIGLLIVLVAHRRRRALGIVGLAVAAGGIAGLAVVALGGLAVAGAESPIDPGLLTSTYGALSEDLALQSAVVLAGGGALAAIGAFLALLPGRRSPRRRPAR